MSQTIRAHFDGKVFVPDEAVNMPAGQSVRVQPANSDNGTGPSDPVVQDRRDRLRAYAGGLAMGGIPLDATRRENLYRDND